MYRPADYPELEGKEPEWVESEREMFKEHRDKDKDGKLNKANLILIAINASPGVYLSIGLVQWYLSDNYFYSFLYYIH